MNKKSSSQDSKRLRPNQKNRNYSTISPNKEENVKFLVDFIDALLVKRIFHRNILKHYHSTVKSIVELFDKVQIDLDFSKNLSVPIKYEPQSMHWHYEQVSVHSSILKQQGEKSYHAYFSHSKVFVKTVLDEMIDTTTKLNETIVIESDNISSQYKLSQRFSDLQNLANKHKKIIIRIYGIAGHCKGEVDHVGGIAKVSIQKAIASGLHF